MDTLQKARGPVCPKLYLGSTMLKDLVDFCHSQNFSHFLLVADKNTDAALGKEVEQTLRAAGFDVLKVVLMDSEVVPDEKSITQVLLNADTQKRVYISVGSGTLTDIARFVSFKLGQPFLSLPTAPSVDGFTSSVAAMVIGGVKLTIPAQSPLAIFADAKRLAQAPQSMIAAGFGDLIGKTTALADWQLGHLLWGEKYDAVIAGRVQKMLEKCTAAAPAIGRHTPESISVLMDALIDSGNCILEFGSSHPASGSEHHLSHYIELKLLREKRPAILHGAKVGLHMLVIAKLYERLRKISKAQAAELLLASRLPSREHEMKRIQKGYPNIVDSIVESQLAYLEMDEAGYEQFKQKVLANWDEVQRIAATVPPAAQLTDLLRTAGCAVTPEELHLTAAEEDEALHYAHYLRPRFTICKLMKVLYPDEF